MYTPYKVETIQRAFNQNLETVVAMPCAHTVCTTIVGWLFGVLLILVVVVAVVGMFFFVSQN